MILLNIYKINVIFLLILRIINYKESKTSFVFWFIWKINKAKQV